MSDVRSILLKIEHLRELLHSLVGEQKEPLNGGEVLRLSQELDRWIVHYTKLTHQTHRSSGGAG